MSLPRVATHLAPFFNSADRYNPGGYKESLPVEECIRLAASVPGLDAVELNFRITVDEQNVSAIKALLSEVGLNCANVSMNIWGGAQWKFGSLSNPDPALRRAAVDLVTVGMHTALKLDCSLISLWPGQDGMDYPFESDYGKMVDWFLESLQACADAVPEVRICIEYKPKEPRSHLLFDTAARTIWLLSKIDRANVGVLLDVGHAWLGYENVAQSAVYLHREGYLDLIHFNDNYGEWDWDLIPGSLRLWESIELIYWLQELNYRGYYSIDIASPRSDPVAAVGTSVKNIHRMYRAAQRLDRNTIRENHNNCNPIANLGYLSDMLFAPFEE